MISLESNIKNQWVYLFQLAVSQVPSLNSCITRSRKQFGIGTKRVLGNSQCLHTIIVWRFQMQERRHCTRSWTHFKHFHVMIFRSGGDKVCISWSFPRRYTHHCRLMAANQLSNAWKAGSNTETTVLLIVFFFEQTFQPKLTFLNPKFELYPMLQYIDCPMYPVIKQLLVFHPAMLAQRLRFPIMYCLTSKASSQLWLQHVSPNNERKLHMLKTANCSDRFRSLRQDQHETAEQLGRLSYSNPKFAPFDLVYVQRFCLKFLNTFVSLYWS